jgi:hypothetical protein
MEPAAERREHAYALRNCVALYSTPQWSPPLGGGSTGEIFLGLVGSWWPQWSPPSDDGSTRDPSDRGPVQPRTAMEPAIERREHPNPAVGRDIVNGAAMKPAGWRSTPQFKHRQ